MFYRHFDHPKLYLRYVTANIFLCSLVHEVAGTESSSISQEIGLISGNVGDMVVLRCFNAGDEGIMFSWYKQTFGNIPQLISTIYKYDRNATFYQEFKNYPRFSVEGGQGKNHLMIADVELSDSGTYYCGSAYGYKVDLLAVLSDSGSKKMPVIHQSVSESVQPGDSVTLNCTIHIETSAGEHSVFWFRHGSGESHPGVIYTHGDRSDQCEKSPEAGSPTQSCVYNLPKRNLILSDAGTYYCAVASCGVILFGNGTQLDIEVFVYIYCIIYCVQPCTVVVIYIIHILPPFCNCSSQAQDADSLHYVALKLSNKKNRSRRQRSNMEEETVYYGIRQ
uniref:Ig-like domain-containing protein n=1 Tax=Oncorhynchus mykiss TaxID=8022 RepID=A0A8K9WTA1_ONCMY